MSARPGRVSSWLSTFAESPTRIAPETERVRTSAQSGMPTSFSVPVVAPRAGARESHARARSRGRRQARSPPPARPRARRRRRASPTSGSRRPRKFTPCGPTASSEIGELAAAMEEAAGGRARCCGARGRARPPPRRGLLWRRRSSCASRRRNPPQPESRRARAAGVRCRCPDSGSRTSTPPSGRTSRRATPLASPKPPPSRRAKRGDGEVGARGEQRAKIAR